MKKEHTIKNKNSNRILLNAKKAKPPNNIKSNNLIFLSVTINIITEITILTTKIIPSVVFKSSGCHSCIT